ncbi:hypothetical protein CO230_01505 [Chryseobacterium sp. 6424]|uniref:glycosyltransferase family 2 protein n=1 Tax=Chryseobacterium sp. 6424 TaxID=2039166 RepID=UPI000EFD5198|nr:glycosyltransferase family 2 protein [Chryseobacterium sp. 6424]AYO56920.1 hypothetical protein CO230_01505 [Chryseobacterium sp. 6424]
MQPLVTIITPSYNHARYLENTVQSVLNQTYPNIEYIIIDDGSSDNSHDVIKALAEKYPQIKYVLHKENKGHLRINEGVKMAQGDYISILSSDDWYLPEKIEKQIKKFQELDDSYGVVYSAGYRYYEDTKEMLEPFTNKIMRKGNILKNLLTEPFFIYPISPLIKKECLVKYPFLPGYRAEGEAVYFRIAMKYKFDFVDEPLVVMRDHSGNTGKDLYRMHSDNISLLTNLSNLSDFPTDLRGVINDKIGDTYFYNGWQMLRNYNDRHGLSLIYCALNFNKGKLINPRFLLSHLLFLTARKKL